MSDNSEFEDFFTKDGPKPEDVFSMVTIMPKKKIKVTAYLEDKDGDRLLTSEIAESLVTFINEQLAEQDSTPINSQLFPLCGQFMTSIVPRFVGLDIGEILFGSNVFRQALITLSLSSVLLMQYIEQHNLKIVTEVTELSEDEVQGYLDRSNKMDERLRKLFTGEFSSGEDDEDV